MSPAPSSRMPQAVGRRRVTLDDDQARNLRDQIAPIRARHAHSPRSHRPFVRDFLRAVYQATGRVWSAAVYRRLLHAYAPERTPSTSTIEAEKQLLVARIAQALAGSAEAPPVPAPDANATAPPLDMRTTVSLEQIVGLQHEAVALISALSRSPSAPDAAAGLRAHNDYLRERLSSLEAELAATRAQAARIAAQLQEAESLAAERARQLATSERAAADQIAALASLTVELDGTRRFMLLQVDGVRGETRVYRDQCEYLQRQLKEKDQQLDAYRQMALSRGPHAGTSGSNQR